MVLSWVLCFDVFGQVLVISHLSNVLTGERTRGGPGREGAAGGAASSQWECSSEDTAQLP